MTSRSQSIAGVLRDLPISVWDKLEGVLERFEDAWRAGQRPALDDYLTGSGTQRRALLVELAHADLHYRLNRGEGARVEDYLGRYPELRDGSRVAIELILAEFGLRQPREPGLAPDDYLRRFPDLASTLNRQFRTIAPPPAEKPANARAVAAPTKADLRPRDEATGEVVVPGYDLLGELGRGGMGVIYKARHQTSGRIVALKMILSGSVARPRERQRFRAEVQAVAALRHPGIVTLYDVGDTPAGPYYTMEYVKGGSLADQLDGTPLRPDDAARLVCQLAEAIHAAHQQGIVHRDLKPANVLISFNRCRSGKTSEAVLTASSRLNPAVPKIADFGLARRIDGSAQTATGVILGTPSYMAPEQAQSKKDAVGPHSDVYALGAILYELLTGRPPFKGPTPLETLVQVTRDEAVPPGRLQPRTPRDLETICLKCLNKEPSQRYASAQELADDLGRYLRREPVQARPLGRLSRSWRWVRRNPAIAVLFAAVMLVLLAGASVAWMYAVVAGQRAHEETVEKQRALLAEQLAKRDTEDEKQYRQRVEEERDRAEWLAYDGQIAQALSAWMDNRAVLAWDYLKRTRPDYRGWEYRYLYTLFTHNRHHFLGHTDGVTALAFSPNGRRLATASADRTVRLWDVATAQEVRILRGHTAEVTAVAFSPDGRRLASASADRTVFLWDVDGDRDPVVLRGHTDRVYAVCFSPDGRQVASASLDRTVRLWDLDTQRELHTFRGHTEGVMAVAFSPRGDRLVSASQDHTVRVWDVTGRREPRTLSGHSRSVYAVAFSPNGKRLASASADQTVRLWDTETGEALGILRGHTGRVNGVCFHPDGKQVASASFDQTVRLWNADSGQQVRVLKRHSGIVYAVAFSPDGTHLASASQDQSVQIGDDDGNPVCQVLNGHNDRVTAVAFSPDGRRLVSASHDWTLRLWDVEKGQVLQTLSGHTGSLYAAAFSSDGRTVASGSFDKTVRLWDAETGRVLHTLQGHTGGVLALSFSPDGQMVASGSQDQTVRLWDAKTGQPIRTLTGHTHAIYSVCFSPDGQCLASTGRDQTIRLWDVRTGQELLRLKGHADQVYQVCFSPDGRRLASAGRDRTIRLWDARTGQELHCLKGHTSGVSAVAFSPDGQRLASASFDQTVRLWGLDKGQEVLTLKGHPAGVYSVAFSPDGQRLATAGKDAVRVWFAQNAR